MVSMKLSALVAAALLGSASAKSGPPEDGGALAKTYPPEEDLSNESVKPKLPPGADNTLETVDGTTVGGFVTKEYVYCNLYAFSPYGRLLGDGSDCAWSVGHEFLFFLRLVYEQLVPYNCTNQGIFYTQEEPSTSGGFVGSPSVCDKGNCCKEYWGLGHPTIDFQVLQQRWDNRWNTYGCSWINEDMYCGLLLFENSWCLEQYYNMLDGTDKQVRTVMMPCTNAYYYYIYKCKTFRAIGVKSIIQAVHVEPENYIEALSAAEANMILSMFYGSDRVCLSLSELDPSTAASSESVPPPGDASAPPAASSGDSAPSGGSTPPASTPAPADDSAAFGVQPMFVFSGLAAIFAVVRAL